MSEAKWFVDTTYYLSSNDVNVDDDINDDDFQSINI